MNILEKYEFVKINYYLYQKYYNNEFIKNNMVGGRKVDVYSLKIHSIIILIM